jgi:polar amino acid transport system substrate-binding protein
MAIVYLAPLMLAGLAAAFLSQMAMADPLLMVYRDKPPYSYVENGVEKGFLLERTRRVMSRAGIDVKFRELPTKRIFLDIQNNEQPICSFGWYKIAEREEYARFSLPLLQDRPHVILAGPRSADAVRRYTTLKSLISDRTLALAALDGVSYGAEIDGLIATFPGRVDKTLQSPLQVSKKVAAQRADFMFIDQDDYDYFTETSADFRNAGLVRIEYPDMPAGLKRYILCSRQVGDDIMRRINTAITTDGRR